MVDYLLDQTRAGSRLGQCVENFLEAVENTADNLEEAICRLERGWGGSRFPVLLFTQRVVMDLWLGDAAFFSTPRGQELARALRSRVNTANQQGHSPRAIETTRAVLLYAKAQA